MQLKAPEITPQKKEPEFLEDETDKEIEPQIEDGGLQEQKLSEEEMKDLVELCGGDAKLAVFYTAWLGNGLNATKAYQALFPKAPYRSARTLGSRLLARVDRKLIASAYGLDHKTYFAQLREGLKATKYVDDGEEMIEVPDHNARRPYHAVLGQMIDTEVPTKAGVAVQVNVGKQVSDWAGEGAFSEVNQ